MYKNMDPISILSMVIAILGLVNGLLALLDDPRYNSLTHLIVTLAKLGMKVTNRLISTSEAIILRPKGTLLPEVQPEPTAILQETLGESQELVSVHIPRPKRRVTFED
jgi:hypothetical protein